MCNIIINTFYINDVKSIDNDVTHRKIFTIINILAIFIFLNTANLLLINIPLKTLLSAALITFNGP